MYPLNGPKGYVQGMAGGTITGDVTITGRTTSAGFTSSIAGTGTLPAYNWSADTNNGLYYSGAADRWELALWGRNLKAAVVVAS